MKKSELLELHNNCIVIIEKQIELEEQLIYNKKLEQRKKLTPDAVEVQYYSLSELSERINKLKDQLHEKQKEYKRLIEAIENELNK